MDNALSVFFWHRVLTNPVLVLGVVFLAAAGVAGCRLCRQTPRAQWLALLLAVRVHPWPAGLAAAGTLACLAGLSWVNAEVRGLRDVLAHDFFIQAEFGPTGPDHFTLSCPPDRPGAKSGPTVSLSLAEIEMIAGAITYDSGPRDQLVAARLSALGGSTAVTSR